jgi:hypothetical protein
LPIQAFHDRIFDLLDERPLTNGEARSFCCLLFGIENELELPDPAINLKEFIKAVDDRLLGERKQWNPVKKVSYVLIFISLVASPICMKDSSHHVLLSCAKKKMTPWINTKTLQRSLTEKRCVIM